MIAAAVTAALPGAQVLVTVSIPGGDEVARRTFNPVSASREVSRCWAPRAA